MSDVLTLPDWLSDISHLEAEYADGHMSRTQFLDRMGEFGIERADAAAIADEIDGSVP